MDDRAIGVFDSGVGGLTVVKELARRLPDEPILYLGDTARVPYGPRGAETIRRFARELVQFLLRHEVKALIVGCNSIAAAALDEITSLSPVPVIDVIRPTVRAAVAATRRDVVGVIGTVATVTSGIYERLARRERPGIRIETRACPLFVPIAEEGLAGHAVARLMAREYLSPLRRSGVDVVILGCTHYPLLAAAVRGALGRRVRIVDSAAPTASALERLLDERGLRHSPGPRGESPHRFFVTDASYKFMQVANSIMGRDVSRLVRQVDVEATGETGRFPYFRSIAPPGRRPSGTTALLTALAAAATGDPPAATAGEPGH